MNANKCNVVDKLDDYFTVILSLVLLSLTGFCWCADSLSWSSALLVRVVQSGNSSF